MDYGAVLVFVLGCLGLLGQRAEKVAGPDDAKTTLWSLLRMIWTGGGTLRFVYLYFGSLVAMLLCGILVFIPYFFWDIFHRG